MKRATTSFMCLLLATGTPLSAEEITAKDLVSLKKLGFSDAEVKSTVERSGTKLRLTDADLQELKAAGAGDDLIKSLKESGPKELSIAAIVEMVKAGKTPEQVLDAMIAAPTPYKLSPTEALGLSRQGVPTPILLAIKGQALSVNELKLLAEGKTVPVVYEKLAALLGYAKQELAPADALLLVKSGVPTEVVTALKAGKAAVAGRPAVTNDLIEYTHPSRYFTIRYPKEWNLLRDIEDFDVRFSVSPESGKKRTIDLDTAFSVSMIAADPNSAVAGQDAASLIKHMQPLFRANEPDMLPQGEAVATKLGQLPAAMLKLKGRPKSRATGIYIGQVIVAQDKNILYLALAIAPEAEFAAVEPILQRIRAESEFGRGLVSRRVAPIEANELVNRYNASVVSIYAENDKGSSWTGTGFIVHKNGYLATNAHVALDLDHGGARAVKYEARFDSDTGRKPLPLTFVGARYSPSRTGLHGVDVAMFKLPPGEYLPLPLTPAKDARLSDPVVTMGFPHSDDFRTLNMFTTGGLLTRFNRDLDGSVESLYIDAKITHGNSGGPCLDRVTGGVIGLNTFGRDITIGTSQTVRHLNDMVGYYGLVPTDVLMAEFPVITDLGFDPDLDPMDFADSFALSRLYIERGRFRAAVDLAKRACQLQPGSADAHCLLGLCLLRSVSPTAEDMTDFKPTWQSGLAELNKALACTADHETSCVYLSEIYRDSGDMVKAAEYADRLVKAHPDHFLAHLQQAKLYQALNRLDEALAAARKSKELARDIQADAYILIGNILYQQNKLDDGKAEFAKASEIHPTNLEARLGSGQYYELKKDYQSALVEYARVAHDLPDTPGVMASSARCLYLLQRYDDSAEAHLKCENRCKDLGQTPPFLGYLQVGTVLTDVKKKPDAATHVYFRGLSYYGATPLGVEMHLRLAKIFRGLDRLGIVSACLHRAALVQPDNAEVRRQLAAGDLPAMTKDDVLVMIKNDVPLSVLTDMVRATPLDFGPTTEDDLKPLFEEGIPEPVIVAIIDSNKAFPAGQPAATRTRPPVVNPNVRPNPGPAPAPAPGPAPVLNDAAHPDTVVGTWIATVKAPNNSVKMTVIYLKTGRFTTAIVPQVGASLRDRGQWKVDGNRIIDVSDETGTTETLPFEANGKTLILEIDSIGRVTFNRE